MAVEYEMVDLMRSPSYRAPFRNPKNKICNKCARPLVWAVPEPLGRNWGPKSQGCHAKSAYREAKEGMVFTKFHLLNLFCKTKVKVVIYIIFYYSRKKICKQFNIMFLLPVCISSP